jgi:hypothetical protein
MESAIIIALDELARAPDGSATDRQPSAAGADLTLFYLEAKSQFAPSVPDGKQRMHVQVQSGPQL